MMIDVGDVTGAEQHPQDAVRDEAVRIGSETLTALERWRRTGLRDEAVVAISAVAGRLASARPGDGPGVRTDAYVLAALLLLHADASAGALATDLVELLA